MANICSYDLVVKGKKENCYTFIDWLCACYEYPSTARPEITKPRVYKVETHYDDNHNLIKEEIELPHHIGWRSTYGGGMGLTDEYGTDEDYTACVYGSCAWSMLGCFLFCDKPADFPDYVLSADEACKLLGVSIECKATEMGCCFAEWLEIDKDGTITRNETTDYYEFDINDYGDYEDFIADYPEAKELLTEEEFNQYIEDGYDWIYLCEWTDIEGAWL